ncbi:MAG: NAD-dependent protein deacylase [Oscillospiraceae bacterium]|nr:NAD-dependent protein deacylase [Oscillospiraceae bacterium]
MTDIQKLADTLKLGGVVFFGGAGVSTESGIPDFRSETGLYAAREVYGRSPEDLISHTCFVEEPELFFRYYKANLVAPDAKPNPAHYALAELESRSLLTAVVTQNIDGLHQDAGSHNVLELHGSNARQYCVKCGATYTLDYIMHSDDIVPKCAKCGGIVRPDVVLYEEGLDERVMTAAQRAISKARTLIVGGTSLAVYPAAGLVRYFAGDTLVLLNKSPTQYDSSADIVIREPIGETMSAVMALV